MYRDPTGFRKLIVVLSPSAGKALALHNGDGRVVWSTRYSRAAPPSHLLRWRRFHDLTHAPQLVVARVGGAGYASVLDGGSGRERERIEFGYAVDKVRCACVGGQGAAVRTGFCISSRFWLRALLPVCLSPSPVERKHTNFNSTNSNIQPSTNPQHPNTHPPTPQTHQQIVPLPQPLHDGTAEQFTYALISSPPSSTPTPDPPAALTAHLLPSGPDASAHLAAAAPSFVFWSVHSNGSSGGGGGSGGSVLAGYAFESTAGGAVAARLAWSVALPGRLLAVETRAAGEPMHTAVKVRLGWGGGGGSGLVGWRLLRGGD